MRVRAEAPITTPSACKVWPRPGISLGKCSRAPPSNEIGAWEPMISRASSSDLGVAIRQALATGNAAACLAHAQRYTWDAATDQFLGALIPAYPEPDALAAAAPPRAVIKGIRRS